MSVKEISRVKYEMRSWRNRVVRMKKVVQPLARYRQFAGYFFRWRNDKL